MKTTLQHFGENLNQEELVKALINTPLDKLREKHQTPSLALLDAFVWSKSPEGNKYWGNIHTRLVNNQNKPL